MKTANSLAGGGSADILRSVAEQLKAPLAVISRQAELAQALDSAEAVDDLLAVQVQASAALKLVDAYLLGLGLAQGQEALDLEPVSLPSVITSAAHDLYDLARQHNVELEVQIAGKYGPVTASQRGLKAALTSLGYGLVEAASEETSHRTLTLAVHRTPHGLVAGMYGRQYRELEADEWRTALRLCGRASQPFTALSAGSGAGLFVADSIMRFMDSRLRVGRHNKEVGLAATFLPSPQLTFI